MIKKASAIALIFCALAYASDVDEAIINDLDFFMSMDVMEMSDETMDMHADENFEVNKELLELKNENNG